MNNSRRGAEAQRKKLSLRASAPLREPSLIPMKRKSILLLGILTLITSTHLSSASLGEPERTLQEGPFAMRGLGSVTAEGSVWNLNGNKAVSLVTFKTESPEKSAIVASKFIADILGYSVSEVPDETFPWNGWTCEVRDAGTWVVGISGDQVHVLSSADREALTAAAESLGAADWTTPELDQHPLYLDNFDNRAMSIWWFGGYKQPEVIEWAADRKAIINAFNRDGISESYAPGAVNLAGWENILGYGNQIDRPHRVMLYAMYGPKWWMRSVDMTQHFESAGEGVQPARDIFRADMYQAAQGTSPEARAVLTDVMYRIMDTMGGEKAMAWKVPPGEWDIKDPAWLPPNAHQSYVRYLQERRGYSLEDANRAHGADAASWDEFPYPETAWFFGRRGEFIDLDNPWHWKADINREDGLSTHFEAPDFDDSDWFTAPRDSRRLAHFWRRDGNIAPLWGRTTITIPEAFLQSDQRTYLYLMPYTDRDGRAVFAWVNGQEAKGEEIAPTHQNRCTAFDITDMIRAGENDIAIYSHGGRIAGRIWMSHVPPEVYPFADRTVTQRWLDWMNFLNDTKRDNVEYWLQAIRAKEPDRPIKQMTGWSMQSDTQDLHERYGGYLQLTGQGAFFRPMHAKGYSRLRGLPTSSEGGSSASNAADLQYHLATMLWEAQDAHDYVFDIQRDLYPREDVVEWWVENEQLISTLGNTDFPHTDPVGLLRDVDQDWLYLDRSLWNWDLSRGPLPKAGIGPVLVDGRDMDKGYAEKVPVLIDTSTVVMTETRVNAILDYVRNGGTFVAGFDTGRHSEFEQDVWPLAKALGLHVEEKSVGEGDVRQSPVLPLSFVEDQDLVPSLRGKTIEGMGIAIDWEDNEYTGAIAIREGDRASAKPIAHWEDGSMAICEIPLGKGRIVYVGTPFYYRAKDATGQWINEANRQALFEEFLVGLGVQVPNSSTDDRMWVSRRESKNGLYDVFFAAPFSLPRSNYDHTQEIVANITLHDAPSGTDTAFAFEMTRPGYPEISGKREGDSITFSDLTFRPFLVRQLAMVREDVGLAGPMHWLRVQSRTWRALDLSDVEPDLVSRVASEVETIAKRLGQDGRSLSNGWRVRHSADTLPKDAWTARDFDDSEWEDGSLGTWLARGWDDTRIAQYRKTLEIPQEWIADGRKTLLAHRDLDVTDAKTGVRKRGALWINGRSVANPIGESEFIDITEFAAAGPVQVSMEVEGEPTEGGPGGSFYLWSLPKPVETLSLNGAWRVATDWTVEEGEVQLPGKITSEKNALGIRRSFDLPEGWAGKPVRLVIEHEVPVGNANANGVLLNEYGYFRETPAEMATYGVRVDQWLQPGRNEIDLYNRRHASSGDLGVLNTGIKDVRLELYNE